MIKRESWTTYLMKNIISSNIFKQHNIGFFITTILALALLLIVDSINNYLQRTNCAYWTRVCLKK